MGFCGCWSRTLLAVISTFLYSNQSALTFPFRGERTNIDARITRFLKEHLPERHALSGNQLTGLTTPCGRPRRERIQFGHLSSPVGYTIFAHGSRVIVLKESKDSLMQSPDGNPCITKTTMFLLNEATCSSSLTAKRVLKTDTSGAMSTFVGPSARKKCWLLCRKHLMCILFWASGIFRDKVKSGLV